MSRGKLKTLLPFLLLLLFFASLAFAQPLGKATILKIIDGDTLWVNFQAKGQKVRLIGMDTPEVGYNWKTKRDHREIREGFEDHYC
jgi:endonuclease YncB( thermonuclease family)